MKSCNGFEAALSVIFNTGDVIISFMAGCKKGGWNESGNNGSSHGNREIKQLMPDIRCFLKEQ